MMSSVVVSRTCRQQSRRPGGRATCYIVIVLLKIHSIYVLVNAPVVSVKTMPT
ncbi:hypothetical protein BD311DRAFT_747777 [Dichomitus squalens]|uniref:Uncharacterized protein n=1 Tax=Dichomitus squalens TaxID=114155 RepID=A0A4Q9N4E9_9APHY|nr:hypothetical protein BD311DRAFT_747777 [Dichomitus squalens]